MTFFFRILLFFFTLETIHHICKSLKSPVLKIATITKNGNYKLFKNTMSANRLIGVLTNAMHSGV